MKNNKPNNTNNKFTTFASRGAVSEQQPNRAKKNQIKKLIFSPCHEKLK